jgi:hypothetical protein
MTTGIYIGFLVWALLMLWFIFRPGAGINGQTSIVLAIVLIGSGFAIGELLAWRAI